MILTFGKPLASGQDSQFYIFFSNSELYSIDIRWFLAASGFPSNIKMIESSQV